MADVIDYNIIGDDMQLVEIELIRVKVFVPKLVPGCIWKMESRCTSAEGGLFKGFKRMLTGESFFITTFLHHGRGKASRFRSPLSRKNNSLIFLRLVEP